MEEKKGLTLSDLDTQKLARYSLEFELLEQKVAVQRLLRDAFLAKVDPQGVLAKLDAKIQELTRNHHTARQKYTEIRKNIGDSLGIDLSEYSYDDESGVLHIIPKEESTPTKE